MADARTLLQLRTAVRKQADCVGDTTTGRHTTSELNVMINRSWRAMRELVSDNGHQLYLKPAVATMAVGPTFPYAFGTISLPSDCVRVYGIDITVAANDIRELLPKSFSERNEYRDYFGASTGIPVGFHIFNVGVESTTTIAPGTVAILPAPDRGYQYTLWYLPSWTDITNDTYVFDGVAGWDEWVIYHTVLQIAMPDNDMQNCAGIAQTLKAEAEKRMLKGANSVQRAGPSQRTDVAARARNARYDSRMRRP